MTGINLPESEWHPLVYAAMSAAELREKAGALVDRLDRDFSDEDNARVGLSFERQDSGTTLALVTSPVGRGRIWIEWGILEGQLSATLVLERQVSEAVAQCGWQRCLKIMLVEQGRGYAGWGDEYRLPLSSMPDYMNRNTIFMLGLMIVHALATGPYEPK